VINKYPVVEKTGNEITGSNTNELELESHLVIDSIIDNGIPSSSDCALTSSTALVRSYIFYAKLVNAACAVINLLN